MITSIAMAITGSYMANRVLNREYYKQKKSEKKFINKWKMLMKYNIRNLYNKNEKTFEILKYIPKYYGCDCIIAIPSGLGFKNLYDIKGNIEANYNAKVVLKLSKSSNVIYMMVCYVDNFKTLNEKDNIKFNWYEIMDSKDSFKNKQLDTFTINEIKLKDYGYDLTLDIPYGISFDTFEENISVLESNLKGIIRSKHIALENQIKLNVAKDEIDDSFQYKPCRLKPYELYFGINHYYEELVSDMFKYPHVLVSGQTGSGKTEFMRMIITNLIATNCNNVDLYFSDLSDQTDFSVFECCKCTRYYAKDLDNSLNLFRYLNHTFKKRSELFRKYDCKNIQEYNKIRKNKKMRYIYLILDEFADYFPSGTDNSNRNKNIQEECYDGLKHLVRKGRKAGIILIIGIQRPDTTVLDPSLKSGLCTKIAFGQNNKASSLVACDTNEVANLDVRYALYMKGIIREKIKSLYITDEIIKKYINKYIDKNHKFIELNKKAKSEKRWNNEVQASYAGDNHGKVVKIPRKSLRRFGDA